jgi:hypothetical protein
MEEPRFSLQAGDEIGTGPGGKLGGGGIDHDQCRPEMTGEGLLEFSLALAPIEFARYQLVDIGRNCEMTHGVDATDDAADYT